MATQNVGKVIQIAGPAVDVEFTAGNLPPIYQALRVTSEGFKVPEPISAARSQCQSAKRPWAE
jgi:F-type H+-transporting ATPase subunit beta